MSPPLPNNITYVALQGDGIRVLTKHDDLKHLFNLRHALELAVWHASYTATGDWDAATARRHAQAAKSKKAAPKRRAYHAAAG